MQSSLGGITYFARSISAAFQIVHASCSIGTGVVVQVRSWVACCVSKDSWYCIRRSHMVENGGYLSPVPYFTILCFGIIIIWSRIEKLPLTIQQSLSWNLTQEVYFNSLLGEGVVRTCNQCTGCLCSLLGGVLIIPWSVSYRLTDAWLIK